MIVAIILLFILIGIGVWVVNKSEKEAIRKRFVERNPISIDEFMKMLDFDIGQECVTDALEDLSMIFNVQKELILPTDRFDIEFAPAKGSELDSTISALQLKVAFEAKMRGINVKRMNIITVRDFIALKAMR